MCSQPRLSVQLLVALLIAGVSRPVQAAVPVPGPVAAARIVVMSVALDGQVRPHLGWLEHAAEAAIARSARFELLPAVDAYDPSASRAREAAVSQAQKHLREGQAALDDLDNLKATTQFVEALRLLNQTNVVTQFATLVQAWVLKAASHATGGENQPARQDIERVVAISASANFPSQFFPPELLQFAESQRRIVSASRGELTVRTEPGGAAVWVDGQYRGPSPTLVKNLAPGRHVVMATLAGYTLGREELPLGEGLVSLKPAELQPALIKAQELISKNPDGLSREQAAMSLGKKLGADQVFLIIGKKSLAGQQIDLTTVRLDVVDGHHWAYQTSVVPMNDEATVGRLFDPMVATDAPRVGHKPVFHTQAAQGLGGKQVAGLVLLGTGAALVGAGVVCGLQAQSALNDYRALPQVETTQAAGVAARGRAFSVMADVSFLLAAGSAVVGSLFLATGGPKREGAVTQPPPPSKAKRVPADDWLKRAPPQAPPERAGDRPATGDSAAEAENKRKEEEARQAKEVKAAETQRKEDERRQKQQDEPQRREAKKRGGVKKAEEERLQREDEARKAKEAEAKKREDEARKAQEAEAQKREDEARKKKKEEDHDDLRNF